MFTCFLLARLIHSNIYEAQRKYYILFVFLIILQTFFVLPVFERQNVIIVSYKYDVIIGFRIKGERLAL